MTNQSRSQQGPPPLVNPQRHGNGQALPQHQQQHQSSRDRANAQNMPRNNLSKHQQQLLELQQQQLQQQKQLQQQQQAAAKQAPPAPPQDTQTPAQRQAAAKQALPGIIMAR